MVFFLILFYFLFLSCLYLGGKPNTQLRKEPGNNLNVFCSSILCEKKKISYSLSPIFMGSINYWLSTPVHHKVITLRCCSNCHLNVTTE